MRRGWVGFPIASVRATSVVDSNVAAHLLREILGMLREAERQLKSSLMDQDMVVTYLELVKVFVWARGVSRVLNCLRKVLVQPPVELQRNEYPGSTQHTHAATSRV